jgi:hypothetical protein
LKGYVACAGACDLWFALLRAMGVPLGEAEGYRLLAGVAAVLGTITLAGFISRR